MQCPSSPLLPPGLQVLQAEQPLLPPGPPSPGGRAVYGWELSPPSPTPGSPISQMGSPISRGSSNWAKVASNTTRSSLPSAPRNLWPRSEQFGRLSLDTGNSRVPTQPKNMSGRKKLESELLSNLVNDYSTVTQRSIGTLYDRMQRGVLSNQFQATFSFVITGISLKYFWINVDLLGNFAARLS